jgi:hypothetical protein
MKNQSYMLSEAVFLYSSSEWVAAIALVASMWLLTSQTRYALLGLPLFFCALGAGMWISWLTAHSGQVAIIFILGMTSLTLLLQGRKGWTLKKVSAK